MRLSTQAFLLPVEDGIHSGGGETMLDGPLLG